MLHRLHGVLSCVRLIEESVRINTIVSVLQLGVTENVIYVAVAVLPNQRNGITIVILERVRKNGSTIRTLDVRFRGIATEIRVQCFLLSF